MHAELARLSPTARYLVQTMLVLRDVGGVDVIGKVDLGESTGTPRRTVCVAMRDVQDIGWVSRDRHTYRLTDSAPALATFLPALGG